MTRDGKAVLGFNLQIMILVFLYGGFVGLISVIGDWDIGSQGIFSRCLNYWLWFFDDAVCEEGRKEYWAHIENLWKMEGGFSSFSN